MRFGAGIWLFGQFVDRYATDAYGPAVSTIEAIQRAGEVGDIEVLDINYPFSDPDITVEEVQRALDAAGIGAWCITPHIYTREFTERRVHQPRSRRPPARARDLRAGRRRRAPARRHDREAVAGAGRLRLPVPGRLPRAVAARARRRPRGRRHGSGHPGRDRVQDQGAADPHQPRDRRAHARRHPAARSRRRRDRRRPRPLDLRQGDARRTRSRSSTTTAASSRSRSTTTGASGTTTWPSARST